MPATLAITSINSSIASGSALKIGDTISLTLNSSASVTVDTTGGAPSLLLSNGAHALYDPAASAAAGADKLVFSYTVASGQDTTALNVSTLELNGASITAPPVAAGFVAQSTFTAGTSGTTYGVALADVNGDGKLDAVVSDYSANKVSILIGDGAGSFLAPQAISVGTRPVGISIGDIDGDGKLDLVVGYDGSSGNLSVLAGDGLGGFAAPQTISVSTGVSTVAVALGNVSGSSSLDIVTTDFRSGKISILEGDGAGHFAVARTIATITDTLGVAVADLNGDGHADIVVSSRSGNAVYLLAGDGAGNFAPQQSLGTVSGPAGITVADATGDGYLDIIAGNISGRISVLAGDGAGHFASPTVVNGGGFGVAVADITADGQPDILSTTGNLGKVFAGQAAAAGAALDLSSVLTALGGVTGLTVDATAPTAISLTTATSAPTRASSLTYTVTFAEAVTGVTAGAFVLHDANGNAAPGTIGTPISSDGGITYTVAVSGLTSEGAVHLDLNASGTGIQDLAGNALSGGAVGTSVTLDHIAPAITLALSADTGLNNHPLLADAVSGALVLNATEFAQALRFGGTVGDANLGNPSGALVTITAADGHAVPPHVVPLQSDGTYAFRIDAPGTVGGVNSSIASALTDGAYTVVAYTQDAAGNIAQTAPTTLIVDTTADVGGDAGLNLDGTADRLINAVEARAVRFTVSGLDADATAVATFTDGTHTVTATVATDGTGTVDLSGLNGTVTSSLAITDVHQNIASVAGSSVLIDTVAPLAPTNLGDLAILNGFVNAAANTAVHALTGTAEAGSTVTVYDGTTILGTAAADAATGRWAYTVGALAEGAHTLSAIATDLAGNNGAVSITLALTVDTLAPAAPTLALTHDTGVSATDGLTRDGTLTLVPSEVGGTLTYAVDGAIVSAYDPASLSQGSHTVAVTQTDAAGNVSVASSLSFTLDSISPSLQADTVSARGLSAPLGGNLLANDTDASPLHVDSVQFGNGPAISVPTSGSAQIAGAHGTLMIASDGSYSYLATSAGHDVFTETVMDAAGNTSQTALTLNVDLAQEATFRFFDTKTLGHLFTTSADEAAQVRANLPSYVQEGIAWLAPGEGTDTVDVFRFYDTKTGDHFLTTSVNERDGLIQSGSSYHYEGVAFDAFANEGASGTATVERFLNAQTGQHHYALAEEANGIRHGLAGDGWIDEGKAFVVQVAPHDLAV